MAITYSAAAGTIITSFLVTQALGDQSQQTGNNQIVLDDIPSAATGYGGNVGVGTLGVGDTYLGRRIMIGRGGTIQERIVTADAAGTGNTRILTVHEDWITNPVATTDTVDVYYELADVEEGGAGGGISLATRTGLWTLTRIITMGNGTDPAGLAMTGGQALECADRGVADSFLVENNGFFRSGYYASGLPIAGGVIAITAATDDEPSQSFAAGSDSAFLDTLIWAQVATLSQISSATATVVYDKTKLLKASEECELYGDTVINTSIAGEAKTTEIVRVDANTVCDGLTLESVQVLDSLADTTTETMELEGVVFSGVAGYVDVRQNKTWNLIDLIWDVTTYTQLTWTGTSTGNVLNDRRSIKVTVQESDGTLLQNTVVVVYENTITGVIELELTTDVNGYAEDSFVYRAHATNSATTTYGGHALRADKWLYFPFVATQTSTDNFNGSVVISTDSNIVQTTQATAITAGASITLNQDTNPSSIIKYTGGTGTLTVGATVTQAVSGATGIVTEILDGDSVAGTVHLKTRNATAFTNGNSLSSGGTVDAAGAADYTANGGTAVLAAYYGEEQIGANYYAFNRYVTCATGTDIESYEFMQYQLRQAGDINGDNVAITAGQGGFGTVNGAVAAGLGSYVGDTLKPAGGVLLRGFDANSTNNIVHSPITVDGGGVDPVTFVPVTTSEVQFPFVAAGNFNFSQNLVDELDAETFYTVYFEYITRTTGSYTLTLVATDTGNLTWGGTDLDHILATDYVYLTGFTTNPTNNGLYLVNSVGANTMNVTLQTGVTLVTETATVTVDENPFESPGAIIVNDNSATPMSGTVSGATIAWDFDYTNNVQGGRTGNTVAPIRVVAQALDGAEWIDATHTITAATGQNIAINAGDERNYSNPV